MPKVSVECPGCSAKLNLPDDSKIGKKIKCPKCSDIFVAEAMDEDDSGDDEPSSKSSGRRKKVAGGSSGSARRTKGGGKKPSQSDSSNKGLLIGGGIAAVVLIAGAALFFSGALGSKGDAPAPAPATTTPPNMMAGATPGAPAGAHGMPGMTPPSAAPTGTAADGGATTNAAAEKMFSLKWFPANTELLLHVKVAEIWKAPLLKSTLDSDPVQKQIAEMKKAIGVEPADIESVTFGMTGLQEVQEQVMMSAMMGGPPKPPKAKGLLIGRTTKAISQSAVMQASPDIKTVDHSGKSILLVPAPPGAPADAEAVGAWIIDSNTFAVGSLEELKTAITTGETNKPRNELTIADPSLHFALVVVAPPQQPNAGGGAPEAMGMPPQIAEMQKSLTEAGASFCIGLNIRGGFDLQVSALMKDSTNATKLKEGLDFSQTEGKKQFELAKQTLQPLFTELGEMLLNSLKVESSASNVVKVSTSIPDSARDKLEQVPAVLAVMAATSGFGPMLGGAGGFGGLDGGPGGSPNLGPGGPDGLNFAQRPGETKPVDSVKADGLPEGLSLKASSGWAKLPSFGPDGKASHPMEILIDVKGDDLAPYCAYGQVAFTSFVAEGGGPLKMSTDGMRFGPDPAKMLVGYAADSGMNFDHPEGTIRLVIPFTPPVDAKITKISAVEGTFKLLSSSRSKEFTIPDAPKKALRPIADTELKAAGVKLLLNKNTGGTSRESLSLSWGKGNFIGRASVSEAGNANEAFVLFQNDVEKGQPILRLESFNQAGKLSEKLEVKFTLYQDVAEKSVSFRFENIELPKPETKPSQPGAPLPGQNGLPVR